jgi:hypothetical protein
MRRIDVDEAVIPLVLEEARKRCDGNMIAGNEMRACGLVHEARQ